MINASDILDASILIVDDQPANISLLEEMLRGAGYQTIASTSNPHEVCELHRQHQYSLILLDLQMPDMDGFQVMEKLKAIETGSYLPVLVLTAQPQHKLRALKSGAKDFVSKPFDLAEVLLRVRNLLEVRLLHRDAELRSEQAEVRREQSESASHAKSQFLANMSHEIRTPMNAVIGLTYLLGETSLDEQQSAILAKVRTASKSLLMVLNNVLDLSKIEAGELIVERAPFDLRALLKQLTDVMAVQADAKKIALEIQVPDDMPDALEGDATRLLQILTNLVSNAIKFTDRGSVKLSVHQRELTPEHAALTFSVKDTGIGIRPDVQARLFMPFAQADASITRRFGGTGLGLSIVKRMVTLMNGEVMLDSTPDVGSEFRVNLEFGRTPIDTQPGSKQPAEAPDPRPLRGVRVLVVDDSGINLEVTKRILELKGAQAFLAANGMKAIDLLAAAPTAIDLVLMDVQMPVLDGCDATRRIRSQLRLVDLPIIALTAGALSSERQRAADAGMNDFIVKPIDAQLLVRSILRHVKPVEREIAARAEVEAQGEPVEWPQIDGIDIDEARLRLSDDFGLFQSTLRRFLDEFLAIVSAETPKNPAVLAVEAARMHKLRGTAGLLAAKAIQKVAAEAEAACSVGDTERAADLATELAMLLEQLKRDAAPTLARQVKDEEVPASDAEIEPQVLDDLVKLLRQQSLSAMDRFTTIAPQLRKLLSKRTYELVVSHIDNLKFSDAAEALEASLK